MQHVQVETPLPAPSIAGNAHAWVRPNSLHAMLLLGSMGTLNSLWSDMLFPGIKSIQQDLGTSATAVQQTVSLYFVACAFMCLWHGVLSDAWGRRKPLFIGLVVLVLTSPSAADCGLRLCDSRVHAAARGPCAASLS